MTYDICLGHFIGFEAVLSAMWLIVIVDLADMIQGAFAFKTHFLILSKDIFPQ